MSEQQNCIHDDADDDDDGGDAAHWRRKKKRITFFSLGLFFLAVSYSTQQQFVGCCSLDGKKTVSLGRLSPPVES